ncbi:MAG: orotidine 5'-phosphate decarboxylase [Thermoplasmata archaeon]|nr:MAG: orotidine 5'-phosphate decarboxylase [Thermoplasmata archaeon]
MPNKPVLQVALDVMNLHRALQIAKEAVLGGVDWIEAGTPLIKSEGLESVRELKRTFPSHTIVADMKTMDVGTVEVEMASKAGADVICIMGVADDATITEAVKAGRRYGSKIMVDLLGSSDPNKRAKDMENFGADFVCLHVGVDQQMKKVEALEDVRKVAEEVNIPVACAGGLNSETAIEVVEAGAMIIIIGSAIIKSPDVTLAAKTLKKTISQKKAISSELFRKYGQEELQEAFLKVSTPNIADAMHTKGAMKGITPRIKHGTKMAGKAITVRTIDGDWAKPVEAIDRCDNNEVLVIDAGGGHIAIWGELASWSSKKKGIAGVVIDGAARDIDDILEMEFPIFSRHVAPNAGEPKGHGEIGCEITCGEQVVRTGDWIIGDESGVVVVPREDAVEIANRALDVHERENRIREEIKRGSTLSEVLKLKKWEKIG